MSRAQTAKRNANDTDRYQIRGGDGGEAEAKEEIPRWYMDIYLEEGPGHTCSSRIKHLKATAIEQRIRYTQARDEFLAWRRKHHKEVVTALRNQVHADPTPALAEFRNLRRLTIFTRLYLVVVPESDDGIDARIRKTVQNWLNGLLLIKQGAKFEKVTFYVAITMLSEDVDIETDFLQSAYIYAGGRDVDGAAEIREEVGHCGA